MTDKPRAADTGDAGAAPGGAADAGRSDPAGERVVIRDNRKINQDGDGTGTAESAGDVDGSGGQPTVAGDPAGPAGSDESSSGSSGEAEPAGDDRDTGGRAKRSTESELADDSADLAEAAEAAAAAAAGGEQPVVDAPAEPTDEVAAGPGAFGAELTALRADLDERTRDLQRLTAEYANYRKRVERDRGLVAEQTTGTVLAALLPTLDDLDRAREHGDLVGPFGTVAEQLTGALTKFGLTAFGEKGDPFDPTRHEAVAHQTSADVSEPTCVDVMRRGYLLGERLLRPALVAVAEPE
ncbi:nucleotide exchange factor GrpE [Plantactinospora sp. GCM10030261]|uniref:nucleotide exchange factor GrpE n=1 Tax=Plantactinospora sp. GCM10030261 TaxID=3273420 RepID=UPI0036234C1B